MILSQKFCEINFFFEKFILNWFEEKPDGSEFLVFPQHCDLVANIREINS